ncbi:MAG: helix-turn-helix domain-containing protein [Marinifilum sp.]|jgi:excisionase family DNA binding protein|nr:helix-turn-helix domain-containing protein [Marinifilum sp.]
MSSNMRIPSICKFCNKAFIAKTTVTQFCTTNCAKKAYKKRKREEKIQLKLQQEHKSRKIQETTPKITFQNKQFLSINESAQYLGVSRWTINRLIKRNKLPSQKIGVKTLIPKSSIGKLFE